MESTTNPNRVSTPEMTIHHRATEVVRAIKTERAEILASIDERGRLPLAKQKELNMKAQLISQKKISISDLSDEDRKYVIHSFMKPESLLTSKIKAEYMQDPKDPLYHFADLFLSCETAWLVQKEKNKLQAKIDAGNKLSEKEQADYKSYKHQLTVFNHKLKEAILLSDGSISRENLASWLSTVGNMPLGGAEKLLAGIGAEVAIADVMRTIPEITHIDMPTFAEDSRGIDIIVHLQNGARKTVDVKTGGAQSDDHRTNNVEIDIDQAEIDGFKVNEVARDTVERRIRQALDIARY